VGVSEYLICYVYNNDDVITRNTKHNEIKICSSLLDGFYKTLFWVCEFSFNSRHDLDLRGLALPLKIYPNEIDSLVEELI